VLADAEKFFEEAPKVVMEMGGQMLETPLSNYFWRLDN
jgi:hypothetical protein